MGNYRPHPGTYPDMWNFQPDDTEDAFYIVTEATINEIMERALDYWGVDGFKDIRITAEHIHTRNIRYDLHDSGDWDTFLKIERVKE